MATSWGKIAGAEPDSLTEAERLILLISPGITCKSTQQIAEQILEKMACFMAWPTSHGKDLWGSKDCRILKSSALLHRLNLLSDEPGISLSMVKKSAVPSPYYFEIGDD